ncbi:hypothetical protein EMPS_07028 [Entomortierella parvispora]|uniref:F-box domain-containing protein n=1 Tax=Entomortierella parvispora TaxID=205924 RepID=A0A9P3HDD2_9FUNG|nr:hypothetical protein EMPS_07028 [Entomortierella parvispora]
MPRNRRREGPRHGRYRHAAQKKLIEISPPKSRRSLADVLWIIGGFLDTTSLTRCVQVDREWSKVLLPILWKKVVKESGDKSHDPPYRILQKKEEHVRELVSRLNMAGSAFPGQHGLVFSNLLHLTTETAGPNPFGHIVGLMEHNITRFIRQHGRNLKRLVLHVGQSRQLEDAMATCSSLESLTTHLPFVGRGMDWMRWYRVQGFRLQTLQLIGRQPNGGALGNEFVGRFVMDQEMVGRISQAPPSSLRVLALEAACFNSRSAQDRVMLVLLSPNLRRLCWSGSQLFPLLSEFIRAYPQKLFCKELEFLSVRDQGEIYEADFKCVVEFCPTLRELDLKESCNPGKGSIMPKQQRLEEAQQDQPLHDSQQHQDLLHGISPSSPLAISEILDLIAQFLDRHSLVLCLRVCHQWYQVFSWRVWEVVTMRTGKGGGPYFQILYPPTLDLISINANHIRKLVLRVYPGDIRFLGAHSMHCPRLSELTIEMVGDPYYRDERDQLLEENLASVVVDHRATLKKLVVHVPPKKELMDAMAACSQLESLTTHCSYLEEEHYHWKEWYAMLKSPMHSLTLIGWKLCYGDSTLHTWDSVISSLAMDLRQTKARGMSLQNLELRARSPSTSYINAQLVLVIKNPDLKRLTWSGGRTIARLAEAFEIFERRHYGLFCQQLESLTLQDHGRVDVIAFKRVIESLPALVDLDIRGYLGSVTTSILTGLRLRTLRIDQCPWATSTVVQDLLCSMPSLQVFSASVISDAAIHEDPRPWVCTGLKELKVMFRLVSDAKDEALILHRVCQLEGLEKLSLREEVEASKTLDRDCGHLQLRLENGLDRLKTLKRLRVFQAPESASWEESEALWVLENWKQLREIDIKMDIKAKQLLGHRLMAR